MKLLNFTFIFMVNATQWQPLSQLPYHMAHMGHNHIGKAYFGKAFAIENEKNNKATMSRSEQMADLVQKMAYTKMILDRLRQYKSLELKSLGKK